MRNLGHNEACIYNSEKIISLFPDSDIGYWHIIHVYISQGKVIKARNIIDFSATYDIIDVTSGEILGSAQRKGLKSILKDTWKLLDVNGNQYGEMIEDSNALVRRFVPFGKWIPARYHMEIPGTPEITLNQLFNPFIRRTVVTIPQGHQIDRRVLAGIALLNASIEGRQSS